MSWGRVKVVMKGGVEERFANREWLCNFAGTFALSRALVC